MRAVGVHAVELADLVRQDHGDGGHLAVEGEVFRDADLLPVQRQEQARGLQRVDEQSCQHDDQHLRHRDAREERRHVPIQSEEHAEGDAQREDVHHAVFQQKCFHVELPFVNSQTQPGQYKPQPPCLCALPLQTSSGSSRTKRGAAAR